jgi:non-receptor tyrosine kinase TNP-like protein
LELLFNKVRGRLGRNNNPNVVEFKNIMKNLWHHNFLRSNDSGNCLQIKGENVVPGGLFPLVRKKMSVQEIRQVVEDEDADIGDLHDVEYSIFHINCLAYISGNVSKHVSTKIDCDKCRSALIDNLTDSLDVSTRKLIDRKNNGDLGYPSGSVYKLVEMTDIFFSVL